MNGNDLDNLLRAADANLRAPRIDSALSAKIRTRAQRRKHSFALATLFAMAATSGVLFWSLNRAEIATSRGEIAAQQINPRDEALATTNARQELQRLRAEADALSTLAQRMCDAEKNVRRRFSFAQELNSAGVLDELRAESDRAAATLVHYAGRLQQAQRPEEAARSYRLVLEKFSATASAGTARARLNIAK